MTPLNEERAAKVKDLLYRKGQRDTVQIANYLSISAVAARRLLLTMTDAGVLDIWAGQGFGSNANIWNLKDQPEPLDPMTRLKEGRSEPRQFVVSYRPPGKAELTTVLVTVIGKSRWRAHSREWGAGRSEFEDAKAAALALVAANVGKAAPVSFEEVADVYAAYTSVPEKEDA